MPVTQTQGGTHTIEGLKLSADREDLRDECSLVARAKGGHEDAFGQLYERHQAKAYSTALRILRNEQDAEDAMQKAFQHALTSLARFREDSTFSTWLTRIVINEALMLLRQRRMREPIREHSLDALQVDGELVGFEIPDRRPTPEETVCENERYAALHHAIGRLRKNLRVVILHRELQGLTNVETAERLGLSVSAVKARTFHARRFLRKYLEKRFERLDSLGKLLERNV
jgi:RNA polymerase sigma-70 factor (ECF subfamily)